MGDLRTLAQSIGERSLAVGRMVGSGERLCTCPMEELENLAGQANDLADEIAALAVVRRSGESANGDGNGTASLGLWLASYEVTPATSEGPGMTTQLVIVAPDASTVNEILAESGLIPRGSLGRIELLRSTTAQVARRWPLLEMVKRPMIVSIDGEDTEEFIAAVRG